MKYGKWVVEIPITEDELDIQFIKDLFFKVSRFIRESFDELQFVLNDIEATGEIGSYLTVKINEDEKVEVDSNILDSLWRENDIQLIEFDLDILSKGNIIYRYLVRDGTLYNILGCGKKPVQLLKYKELPPRLFDW